jgi:hypothetical protein
LRGQLAERVVGIKSAIDLEINNKIAVGKEIPRAGYIINQATREQLFDSEIANDANDSEHPSSFYRDDTTLTSVKADLAKKQTTCMIADYCWRVRHKIMKDWWNENKNNLPDDGSVPANLPAASLGAFFMCDGQPANQLMSLIAADNGMFYCNNNSPLPALFPEDHADENDESDDESVDEFSEWLNHIDSFEGLIGSSSGLESKSRFKGKFMTFFGGFHATNKLHNCRGLMFGNMISHFFSAWRNTTKKVLWILYPSDPRQLENELPQYILTHYRSAFILATNYFFVPSLLHREEE